MQREFFRAAYQERRAAWDVPFPQPAVVAVAAQPGLRGPILDLGCGTGENALYLATLGFDVTGIDFAPAAIEAARSKAQRRGLSAMFRCDDALRTRLPAHSLGAIIDSGFFHGLTGREQRTYWHQAERLLAPGGRLLILGFSDSGTEDLAGELAGAPPSLRLAGMSPTDFLLATKGGVVRIPALFASLTAQPLPAGRGRRNRPGAEECPPNVK